MGKTANLTSDRGESTSPHLVEVAAARQVLYLTKEEVERFFTAIPTRNARDRLLFDVMYRYGLRRVEATLIRRREHLSDGRIWITRAKGGVSGEYPIHPATRRLLWTYLSQRGDDDNPHLFVTRESGSTAPISAAMIYHLFRRYAELANLPADRWHCHVLRHSIAVHLMNAGWDVADIQDWLGHRDIASTMVYATVTNKRREARYQESLLSKEIAANDIS